MKNFKLSLAIAALAIMVAACTNADRKQFDEKLPQQQAKCPVQLDIPAKLTIIEYNKDIDVLALTFEFDESRYNLDFLGKETPDQLATIMALQLPLLDEKLDSLCYHFAMAGKTQVDYTLVGNQLATTASGRLSHDMLLATYMNKATKQKLHMDQAAAWLETSAVRPWTIAEGIALVGGGHDGDSLQAQVMIDAEKYAPSLLETEGFADGVIKSAVVNALKAPNSPLAATLKQAQTGMNVTVAATFQYFHVNHALAPNASLDNVTTWMGKVQPTTQAQAVNVAIPATDWQ